MYKRTTALLLALVMVIALMVPVNAAASITTRTQGQVVKTCLLQAGYTQADADEHGDWYELAYYIGLLLREDDFDPDAACPSSFSRTLSTRNSQIRRQIKQGIDPVSPTAPVEPEEPIDPPTEPTDPPTEPTTPPTEPTDPPTEPTTPPTEPVTHSITITSDLTDVDAAVNAAALLQIQASASNGAALSYQWYSCTNASGSGASKISGATSATYTAPTSARGTRYYYCIVSASGMDSVQSRVAAVNTRVMMRFDSNGLAQPILTYVSGKTSTCNNASNDIVRFCVWVETDYDTDGDGKLDLVKVLVQLPRAAMDGDYQAPVIFEARPYVEGTNSSNTNFNKNQSYSFDNSKLYSQPAARTHKGSTTTAQQVANTNYTTFSSYENLDWYDYFLVRGYAIVTAHGLGGKNSEGWETCGTDLEIDAFACVIEWLNNRSNRTAFTDTTNCITIDADWSNGKIGMTGRSYAGTTQYALAALGVDGLETIVPVAGISSWYERLNSQGLNVHYGGYFSETYMEWLAFYCCSRYTPKSSGTIYQNYCKYLSQMAKDEAAANGDFTEFWEIRDYTLDSSKIKCPALMVHGFNDNNVAPKHFQLMYDNYKEAGVPVKLLLHQGGHITPAHNTNKVEMYVSNDGETYQAVLNEWFSHYLCGVDNGAPTRPEVTVQSNVDGSWLTVDSWSTDKSYTWDPTTTGTKTINSTSTNTGNFQTYYLKDNTNINVFDTMPVTEDMTIQGVVKVNLKAAPADNYGSKEGLAMTAFLVDMSDSYFNAFPSDVDGYVAGNFNTYNEYFDMGGGATRYQRVSLKQNSVKYKIIARGACDLADPYSGYRPEDATDDPSFTLVKNTYNDYTIYLQPCHYTVKKGHKLALVICTYDPIHYATKNQASSHNQNYSILIDRTGTNVVMPLMPN